MGFAYATTNRLTGLAAASFTVSTGAGPANDTRLYLNDGQMAAQYTLNSGTTTEAIDIDLGAAQSVSAIAILNHNLAALGSPTVTVTAADNAGFSVGVVTPKATTTLNTTSPKHKDHVLQFGAVSKRYWRITFTHSLSTSLKIGELFAAASTTQLTRGQIDGSGEGFKAIGVANEMQYGSVRSLFFAGPVRRRRLRFQDWTEAQKNELLTMWSAVNGPFSPLLWIESYEAVSTAAATAQQECIFGRLRDDDFEWTFTDFLYRQVPELVITSEGRERGA